MFRPGPAPAEAAGRGAPALVSAALHVHGDGSQVGVMGGEPVTSPFLDAGHMKQADFIGTGSLSERMTASQFLLSAVVNLVAVKSAAVGGGSRSMATMRAGIMARSPFLRRHDR